MIRLGMLLAILLTTLEDFGQDESRHVFTKETKRPQGTVINISKSELLRVDRLSVLYFD